MQIEPDLALGDEGTRADGKFFFSYFIDTCVVHPSSSSYLRLAHRPLAVTLAREQEKTRLYGHAAQIQGAIFFPAVFETFGAFGPSVVKFISKLVDEATAGGVAVMDGQPIRTFIYRCLSFTLQLGNADLTCCLLNYAIIGTLGHWNFG